MPRRLLIALLALAVVGGGVASCPCIAKACAMAQAKAMSCCEKAAGLNAPDCCPGGTQLSRQDAAPAAVNPAAAVLAIAATVAPFGTTVMTSPEPTGVPALAFSSAAPPGGTLVAQHTSLLL
jgi:hypothetical protein